MIKHLFFLFTILILTNDSLLAQREILTKEGRPVLDRRALITDCLNALNKSWSDVTAVEICECQIISLDRKFTNKQYKKHTRGRMIDLASLIKEDSTVEQRIKECYTNSGQTMLLQAQGFESEFISDCFNSIKESSEKTLDENKVRAFCSCQLELVKTKKLTDAQMKTLRNPNSVLFYEMIYTCGDPYSTTTDTERNWTKLSHTDVKGPAIDTIDILNLNGMTYVKMKIGSMIFMWLLDTGASDLLINAEMEETLKQENILTEANYLGIGEYEMANGTIDTCRKYKINNVRLGKFYVDNITVAVSDKGKRIIAGKSLLNKFSTWILNNETSILILTK